MREGLEDVRGSSAAGVGAASEEGAELSVVGADPADPSVLLLRAGDGSTFRLPVDGRLRAALRTAGPAPAPVPTVSGPLRPRDIQARIRAGETAADVAADAGVPIEQVRRYEGPVLAERAHVASLARLAVVRGGPGRLTLEDAVRSRLLARGADPGSASWDAWRRDGGWAVQVGFRAAGRDRSAQWSFAPSSRVLEALDDEARWLTAPSDDPTGRRLAAVRVYDVETDDGGVDGLPALAVPGPPTSTDHGTDHGTDRVTAHPADRPVAPPGSSAGTPPLPTPPGEAGLDPVGRAPEEEPGGVLPGPPSGAAGAATPLDAEPEDVADDLASRTLDLLDALRDRRGRRVPLDLDGDGNPWDDDDEDDDLLNALLDLPPGTDPGSEELQEEVDRARARLRMVTPPQGLSLRGPSGRDGAASGEGDDAGGTAEPGVDGAPSPGRASLGLVPAPPPTAPLTTTPATPAAPTTTAAGQGGPAAPGPRPTAPPVRTLSAAPSSPQPGADLPTSPEDSDASRQVPAPGSRRERRAAEVAGDQTAEAPPAAPTSGTEAEHDGDDPSEQPAKRRRSVPSWDEIVFGAPRRD